MSSRDRKNPTWIRWDCNRDTIPSGTAPYEGSTMYQYVFNGINAVQRYAKARRLFRSSLPNARSVHLHKLLSIHLHILDAHLHVASGSKKLVLNRQTTELYSRLATQVRLQSRMHVSAFRLVITWNKHQSKLCVVIPQLHVWPQA